MDHEQFSAALTVGLKVLGIMVPVLLAFAMRDKARLTKLFGAIPEIYTVIEQEKRKGDAVTKADPLRRGVELQKERLGGLSSKEEAITRQELQAHHERVRAQEHYSNAFHFGLPKKP